MVDSCTTERDPSLLNVRSGHQQDVEVCKDASTKPLKTGATYIRCFAIIVPTPTPLITTKFSRFSSISTCRVACCKQSLTSVSLPSSLCLPVSLHPMFRTGAHRGFWPSLKRLLQPVEVAASGPKRNSSISYGVMVIDMGVHELDDLDAAINVTQVSKSDCSDTCHSCE
jgi:hypothetical protein